MTDTQLNLTDTHAHLDYPEYDPDRDAVLTRAREAGVSHIITVGIGTESIRKTLRLLDQYPALHAIVGVHPTATDAIQSDEWSLLEDAARHPRVAGLGEMGLDYFHLRTPDSASEKRVQQEFFRRQMQLAAKIGKPVVIHCRNAYEDTLAILREFERFRAEPGVMHCYSGTMATAQQVFELGYSISVGGIVTFKNAPELREVVTAVPHDRLMLETDCPYLAPMPHRGKRNEPSYVRLVAERVASLWRIPLPKTAELLASNVKRVFGIGAINPIGVHPAG